MRIDRQILRIAVPSIISNVTVPLLGLVDLAIVGHMNDAACIGAIALGSTIFNVIYWIFGFLRMGTSGMTAQALGAERTDEVSQLLFRSLAVAFAIALVFIILQRPVRWLAFLAMQPSAEVTPYLYTYYDICIWGMPAMLSLYGFTGWYIGMQNTRIPMFVSIVQNIINIVCSLSFVILLHWGMKGVALGTVIAQWAGFLISLSFCLKYYRSYLRRTYLNGVFNRAAMLRFFNVNRDIFIRTLFLVGVNLFFTAAGSRQGTLVLSANALLLTLYTISSYVLDGFAYAGEALCGKAYGAHDGQSFCLTRRHLYAWGYGLAVCFTMVFAWGGRPFLQLLTNDVQVIDAAMTYLPWAVMVPIAGVGAFILDGVFIGITATRGMLLSSALSAIAFFLLYFSLFRLLGNHALWLSMFVYLALRGVVSWLYLKNNGTRLLGIKAGA